MIWSPMFVLQIEATLEYSARMKNALHANLSLRIKSTARSDFLQSFTVMLQLNFCLSYRRATSTVYAQNSMSTTAEETKTTTISNINFDVLHFAWSSLFEVYIYLIIAFWIEIKCALNGQMLNDIFALDKIASSQLLKTNSHANLFNSIITFMKQLCCPLNVAS